MRQAFVTPSFPRSRDRRRCRPRSVSRLDFRSDRSTSSRATERPIPLSGSDPRLVPVPEARRLPCATPGSRQPVNLARRGRARTGDGELEARSTFLQIADEPTPGLERGPLHYEYANGLSTAFGVSGTLAPAQRMHRISDRAAFVHSSRAHSPVCSSEPRHCEPTRRIPRNKLTGQSGGLLIRGSQVRILPGAPPHSGVATLVPRWCPRRLRRMRGSSGQSGSGLVLGPPPLSPG
jgi:hypothetical protein